MCRVKMSMTLWYVLLTFLLFHCLSWISPSCIIYFSTSAPPGMSAAHLTFLHHALEIASLLCVKKQSVVFLLHLVCTMKMENLFRVLLKIKTECSNKMIKQATVFIMTFEIDLFYSTLGHFFKEINWIGWYTRLLTYFVSSVTCRVVYSLDKDQTKISLYHN